MAAKYTHAWVIDGRVQQLFTQDPGLPPQLNVIDVSGFEKIGENWKVSSNKASPPEMDKMLAPNPDLAPAPSINVTALRAALVEVLGKDKTDAIFAASE